MSLSGKTIVAGIAGQPVSQSLSPVLHNAWLAAAGIDGVYVPFAPARDGFKAFIDGLRGGSVVGLNITIPFKEEALALADTASDAARRAGAANVLVFRGDGSVHADNTDGVGLIEALRVQAPKLDLTGGPTALFGAGGAARGAVAALLAAGSPEVRVVNRTRERAEAVAEALGHGAVVYEDSDLALEGAVLVVNSTSLGMNGGPGPVMDLARLGPEAVVMDMVFKPLRTELLKAAAARGLTTVDGLEMLICQAVPSYAAFFGAEPPQGVDVRALALKTLGENSMKIVGLTGSIGMGKSTTVGMFREEGVPVYDADAEVHKIYEAGGTAAAPLEAAFPGVTRADGSVDRAALSARVQGDNEALSRVNRIVHPLLGAGRMQFFKDAEAVGADIIVLDIPLLFETGGGGNNDAIVVVSAPADVQAERVMAREGMTAEKFAFILGRQTPDADKRARADFVIDTGRGLEPARAQVREILATLRTPGWVSPRLAEASKQGQ